MVRAARSGDGHGGGSRRPRSRIPEARRGRPQGARDGPQSARPRRAPAQVTSGPAGSFSVSMMDRRTFLTTASLVVLATPQLTEGQPASRIYTVGLLSIGAPDSPQADFWR